MRGFYYTRISNDIKNWESKFQPCQYSDKLLNLITDLNMKARIPSDIKTIKKACFYARVYHGNQKRKSGEPYYSHPLEVAYLFAEYVGNNKQQYYTTALIVIAILHDTIEDTKLTYEMIVKSFSKYAADGVRDLSRVASNGIKHKAYVTLYKLEVSSQIDILYIKIFDRLHNMRTIGSMSNQKQLSIIEETRDHFLPFIYKYELNELEKELWEMCNLNPSINILNQGLNNLQRHESSSINLSDRGFNKDTFPLSPRFSG